MLRCQTVVLGVVAMATLPMVCLSARSVTWPTHEKSFAGPAKNRKGLRHSPGVLMDVMRTPTSVKSSGFPWSSGDQLGSFSGGRPHHYYPSPHKHLPMNNFIVTRNENNRRKPYSTFKERIPQRHVVPTLNFAPSNAIPWHTSVHTNFATTPRPSSVWRFVPYFTEPENTTARNPEPEESRVVYRYTPPGTEAPASFTTSGTPRKTRHHVRLFSNAHQYKRDMDDGTTMTTPWKSPPLPTDVPRDADILVDANAIDEEHKQSRWFKQLLGQVIAAAEMTDH